MNNQKKFILIFGVLMIMGLLIWLLSGNSEEVQGNKGVQPYVSSSWNNEYLDADKDPKGLYLFNKLLRTHIDTSLELRFLMDHDELMPVAEDDAEKATYVFVGNEFGLLNEEVDSILARVNEGSTLFLAYHVIGENIIDELFYDYDFVFDYDEEINVFMNRKKHQMINLYQNDTVAKNWFAFSMITEPYEDYTWKGHSSFMELFNLIEIEVGEGSVFLCSTPEVFQNYQVQRKDGFAYTKSVIDLLPDSNPIYFLELGRLSDDYGTEDVDELLDGEGKRDDSYLRIIFENRTLLKAFLFGILGLLIFLIFRSKRIRPIVPYLEPKKNTTSAFTETITSIYFSKRNPYGMLNVQRRNFYAVVQKHFFIDLNRREDERALVSLSEKSNISLDEIKVLIGILETKEAFDVSDDTVVKVHKLKQDFYKRAGIIAEHVLERERKKEVVIYRRLWLPATFILVGLAGIIFGFYLLVGAHGVGIALWLVGGLILFLGVRQLQKPLMIVNRNEMISTPSFGLTRSYKMDELLAIDLDEKNASLLFKDEKRLIINLNDMGRFEKAKFKRALLRMKNEELW